MSSTNEPRLLILETSGGTGAVALAHGAQVIAGQKLDQARRHARDLAVAVHDLLRRQGWRPADIQAVLVSLGPGSYTGLRVGVMSAKAFAYATGCAVIGLETFAAIAVQAGLAATVDVIADAQQNKVYSRRWQVPADSGLPAAHSPLRVIPIDAWLSELTPAVTVTGPGLRLHRARVPEGVAVVGEDGWDPQPESVLRLGLERWKRGERDDLWTLEPLYLRPSSAEEKLRVAEFARIQSAERLQGPP